ncbi:PAS domain-containing sensor histidine kinase [Pontibacter mangrovi]|uniref:histidine kinase n=1 Tax=Pontibacter mangrovi TaxID=2589816 RepID=A0A501W9T7_9BACT|nr:PAS domain-containing sensor histidine kinase [Pontibacter mangrovi]TPE46369.1 PAS domain S-box protein [Pontibacter mangrovi]
MQPEVLQGSTQSRSQDFYSAILANSPHHTLVLGPERLFTFISDALATALGYRPEELLGTSLIDLLHPQDFSAAQEALDALLITDQLSFPPFRLMAKNGAFVWFEGAAKNMLQHAQIAGILLHIQQVPGAGVSAQYVHQAYYESLFFEHPDAVFTLDLQGCFQKVNRHMETLTGYPDDQLLGASYSLLLHPEGYEDAEKAMQNVWAGQSYSLEASILTRQGKRKEISIAVIPVFFKGVLLGAEGIARDITEEKKRQREVEQLSLMASKTVNGVVIMDAKGRIEWVNDGFCRLTGYNRTEVVGHVPSHLLQGAGTDPAVRSRIFQKYEEKKPFSEEVLNYRKTGEQLWLCIDVMPIFDQDGELINYVAIQTDVTEKKEAEKKLLKLADDLYKHNLDLQQFTYMISHNLRAPLANALGLSQLMQRLSKESDSFDTAVVKLHDSVHQLDEVVRDINQILSLRDSGRVASRQKVCLLQVCHEVLDHLQQEITHTNAKVTVQISPDVCLISIHAYLYSILYNLLSNSLKYRSQERALELTIAAERDARGYVLTVSDNGSGMEKHLVQHHLFQLYKRFHPNTYGKGIGLFLVKTQVQALSGKIEVESAPEAGTTFKIYLGAKHV